jgi:restriction system protein
MARHKKTSPAEDIMDHVAMLPWWAGVTLGVISYVLLHGVASQAVVPTAQPGQMSAMVTQTLWKTLASIGQYVLPALCLAGAGTSAWRRKERKNLVIDVMQSEASDALDGMSWREFEMLVGEGFRLQAIKLLKLAAAVRMVVWILFSGRPARPVARSSSCSASSGALSRWAWTSSASCTA